MRRRRPALGALYGAANASPSDLRRPSSIAVDGRELTQRGSDHEPGRIAFGYQVDAGHRAEIEHGGFAAGLRTFPLRGPAVK